MGSAAKPAPAAPKPASSPVSQRSVELVQASWGKVMPISDAAAALFYDRLFELDPSVRPLFKEDITEQKKKLMQTLSVAVDGLSNVEKLVPVLQSLGARHAGYMVVDRHYDLVGEALLWTLREGLADDFTGDVEKAWTEVYGVVAGVMKKAAADHTNASVDRAENEPILLAQRPAPSKPAAASAPPTVKAEPQKARPTAPSPEPAPKAAGGGPSAKTISIVQSSWAKVMPISDAAATLFYDRLFELDPSVRPLFKHDMREQKKKLMQTLAVAVDGLNNLPRLVPVLKDLGARHTGYMVADHHYDTVGAALLWTLHEGLGDEFTPEVEAAWTEIYTLVAGVMKSAAAEQSGRPAAPTAAPSDEPSTKVKPLKGYVEDEDDTLHYDSSRRPPVIDESSLPAKASAEKRSAPVPAAGRTPEPAAAKAPARAPEAAASPAKAEAAPSGFGVVLPLAGKDVTLNVRLTLDDPRALSAARDEKAPAPQEAASPGGAAPALLLAILCAAASIGVATIAPGLGAPAVVKLGALAPLGVGVLVLTLIATAFGLGYLWGRGRRAQTARAGSGKAAAKE